MNERCRYRSGAKFTGQFEMDMFCGQGELIYADGSVYCPALSSNHFPALNDACATVTAADGPAVCGTATANSSRKTVSVSSAQGAFSFLALSRPAGSIVGTFEHGLPCGDAVRVMASGAKYSGGFVAGLYAFLPFNH